MLEVELLLEDVLVVLVEVELVLEDVLVVLVEVEVLVTVLVVTCRRLAGASFSWRMFDRMVHAAFFKTCCLHWPLEVQDKCHNKANRP